METLRTKEDFFLIIRHGALEVAQEAVEAAKPRLTMNGQTLLFAAAARPQSLDGAEYLCRRLVAKHVNVRDTDGRGRTPLFYAAEAGHAGLCAFLVAEVGMELERQDDVGLTPLACALQAGHIDASISLLRQGASLGLVNKEGKGIYQFASEGTLELLRERLSEWAQAPRASGSPGSQTIRTLSGHKRKRGDSQSSRACGLEALQEWALQRPKCFVGEPQVADLAGRVIVGNDTHATFVPTEDAELRKVRLLEKALVVDQARLFASELFVHSMRPEHWADALGTHASEGVATDRARRVVRSTSSSSETIVAAICRDSGHIVGFSRASARPGGELYVETLKVQAGHELQGIARLMVQAVEIRASHKGFTCKKLGSRCLRRNLNAQRFFKQLGFVVCESEPTNENESPLSDCIKFERPIVRHRICSKSSA